MISNSYVEFLFHSNHLWNGISPTGRSILKSVIRAEGADTFRLKDIIQMTSIASPSRLQKSICDLLANDHLRLQTNRFDRRAKSVILGKNGVSLVKRLNNLLTELPS